MAMNPLLVDARVCEYSELDPATARKTDQRYEAWCARATLAPAPGGWGFLHCTVQGPRRRRRVTLATADLSYHRTVLEAAAVEDVEPSWSRYTYFCKGWPGVLNWSGNWSSGGVPIPWEPTHRDACPETLASHVHCVRFQPEREPDDVCLDFTESVTGVRWTEINNGPVHSPSQVVEPRSDGFNLGFSRGVALIPGWPTPDAPQSCVNLACVDDQEWGACECVWCALGPVDSRVQF